MYAKKIWLSYDLGTLGDYEDLYAWLDDHNAKDCGRNLAVLEFDYDVDVFEELIDDLNRSVELDRQTRIYVMLQDHGNDKMVGRFVKGRRKQPPWTGFGNLADPLDDCD